MSDGTVETEWQITLPKNWDVFWDNIQDTTNGYDIVLTDYDGETVLTYDLSGFNHTTKTCTIRWNDSTAAIHSVYWIYWNKTSPSDLTGTPTTVSPATAVISLLDPTRNSDVMDMGPERPGSTAPSKEIHKAVSEGKMVWARLPSGLSMSRMHPSAGSDRLYEVFSWSFVVLQGGSDASLDTPGANRIVEDRNGDTWLGVSLNVLGWTDATDYTGQINATIAATGETGVTVETTFLIKCNDPNEV